MIVVLPREGKTIDDALSSINTADIAFSPYTNSYNIDLKLPRIQTGTTLPLVDVMKEMGMTRAFDEVAAEFPYFGNRGVFISNMFQKAAIDLDEEGTEAAAVTIIEDVDNIGGYRFTFHANRPFFYIISEQSTGAIFFMGQYTGLDNTNSVVSPFGETKEGNFIYDLSGRRIDSSFFTLRSSLKKGIYIQKGKKILR
jgi:serpin B